MRRSIFAGLVCLTAPFAATGETAEFKAISAEEAAAWTRRLTPLPRQVQMSEAAVVPATDVVIAQVSTGEALVQQTLRELQECLGQQGRPQAGKAGFTLSVQLGGAEAESFKPLKNASQAYRIIPEADKRGLRLVAMEPRGLYYAGKTVQQLLKARTAGGSVTIPLVTITDWPDMEDRGLWGGDASNYLRWISDRKMNYLEHISHTSVDKDKRCHVSYPPYKQRMIDEGPTYGINPVPVILHLEQLTNTGLFDAYPDLQGKDATPGVICYSNPKMIDVLAEWLVLWGQTPGVSEVDVWMAENMYGKKSCQCDECRKEDRSVLETRMILKGWEKARQRLPRLGLRILTSEATEKSNPRVIALLPGEVKLWYYHSLFTYNTSHAPMIRRYLVEHASKGGWVGVCPNICPIVGFWTPMTGAAFIHARMNEFVDKGLSGLIGYAVPSISFCRFNTEAAAEWSWNAKGRTPKEFALSWAVREGLSDSEKFAEWSETIGPVSWDVYGSEWPSGERRGQPGKSAKRLKEGKLGELGTDLWGVYRIPWGEIKSIQQLDHDVGQAGRAVALAREMGNDEFLQESLVTQGHISAIKALWELRSLVRSGQVGEADKPAARQWFKAYADGLRQAAEATPRWGDALPKGEGEKGLLGASVKHIQGMIEEMNALAAEFGCGE
jgi:hypothetical protein